MAEVAGADADADAIADAGGFKRKKQEQEQGLSRTPPSGPSISWTSLGHH